MEVIAIFEQLYFQPVKQIAYCHVTFDWPVTLTRDSHLNEPQIYKTVKLILIHWKFILQVLSLCSRRIKAEL